jgi:hypothetical protein
MSSNKYIEIKLSSSRVSPAAFDNPKWEIYHPQKEP